MKLLKFIFMSNVLFICSLAAVPLDPLAGTHSAAEQNAEQNAEQPVGHASDMRSGTLVPGPHQGTHGIP